MKPLRQKDSGMQNPTATQKSPGQWPTNRSPAGPPRGASGRGAAGGGSQPGALCLLGLLALKHSNPCYRIGTPGSAAMHTVASAGPSRQAERGSAKAGDLKPRSFYLKMGAEQFAPNLYLRRGSPVHRPPADLMPAAVAILGSGAHLSGAPPRSRSSPNRFISRRQTGARTISKEFRAVPF